MTAHAHIAGRVTAYPRKTDCGVDGIYAQRSTETSRSSPVAAQRCAEGAGLDGGDLGRSTIICAVHHTRRNSTDDDLPMNVFATSRIYTSLTGTTVATAEAHFVTTNTLRNEAMRMPRINSVILLTYKGTTRRL